MMLGCDLSFGVCPLTAAMQRHFWGFTAAFFMYGQFSSDIVLSGDFNLKADIYASAYSNGVVFGSTPGAQDFVRIANATTVRYQDGVNNVDVTVSPSLPVNELYTLEVDRTSTTLTVNAIGQSGVISTGSATVSVADLTINTIAQKAGINFFDGVIANTLIEDAGTLIADFPLDTDLSNPVIANRAAGAPGAPATLTMQNMTTADATLYDQVSDGWTGSELWTFGDAVSLGTEGAFGTILLGAGILTNGRIYKYSSVVSGLTSGDFQLRLGSKTAFSTTVDGLFEGSDSANAVNAQFRNGAAPTNAGATAANISIKRLLEVA